MKISDDHPRKNSLDERYKISNGVEEGYVAMAGLIAHGRGEAFDYLIGEKTIHEADTAERAAVAALLIAKNPVLSVNGNVAALCPIEIVELGKVLGAKLEVNLFYRTLDREKKIEKILKKKGAKKVYGVGIEKMKIDGLDSERAKVSDEGILDSDAILVPLEDGDRAEALVKMGKTIIAIDLNPLSRTAQKATITIVDNITRAIPNMIKIASELKNLDGSVLAEIIEEFDNQKNLELVVEKIRNNY